MRTMTRWTDIPTTYRLLVRESNGTTRLMGVPLGCTASEALAWAVGLRDMGNVAAVRVLFSIDGFQNARTLFDV